MERYKERVEKNRASYILQLIVLIVLGSLIVLWIPSKLKPQTDISVDCEISKQDNVSSSYSLKISFNNKADFAGKNFHIYIWRVTSNSWGSDYSVSEHCERVQESDTDRTSRFKIYCDFIPPKSEFGFHIDTDLNEEIIKTGRIDVEWWGETSPYEFKSLLCK